MTTQRANNIFVISTSQISPDSFQARKNFDETSLNELAASLKQYGMINPVIVYKTGYKPGENGKEAAYTLIAGERRWRAAQIAGLTEIPAVIRKGTEQEITEIALSDNIQRVNLSPIEEAEAFAAYINTHGCNEIQLAARLGISRDLVIGRLALLDLSQEIQDLINDGTLPVGHAMKLGKLDAADQKRALKVYLEAARKLDSGELKHIVREIKKGKTEEEKDAVTEQMAKQVSQDTGSAKPWGGKAAAESIKLPATDHPIPACRVEHGWRQGDIFDTYMKDLMALGLNAEAAAVGQIFKVFVENSLAFIPGNQLTRNEGEDIQGPKAKAAAAAAAFKASLAKPDPKRDAMKDMADDEI